MKRLIALSLLVFGASISNAAVIFEPVQYQYGTQSKFYYGGHDPRVISRGLAEGNGYCGMNGYGDSTPVRIYCDCIPGWNAAVYGMTTWQARDRANWNVPRYFRKGDLLNAAEPTDRYNWVVPAQAKPVSAGTIVILPSKTTTKAASHPTTKQPVFIFPKEMLDKPVIPHRDPMASAD